MRDEGVIYVAGHPLLNRRCTRLPGCTRLRTEINIVSCGASHSTHALTHLPLLLIDIVVDCL